MSNIEDSVLVVQAKNELPYTTLAYEILTKRYHGLIYRTCFGILRDTRDAEDASQLVLLKIFNSLHQFEQRSSFKTWLLRIVSNTCFTLAKKRQREVDAHVSLPDDEEASPELIAPLKDVELPFDLMIEKLDIVEKQILTLRFVSELSLNEVADIMSLGLSAVKMRYYRAIEKLKHHQD